MGGDYPRAWVIQNDRGYAVAVALNKPSALDALGRIMSDSMHQGQKFSITEVDLCEAAK